MQNENRGKSSLLGVQASNGLAAEEGSHDGQTESSAWSEF